jgi:site-specific DNA recombinase
VSGIRRIATYERVSSDDQRDRETIKTQTDILDRAIAQAPEVELVERYRDDGASGTIPFAQRRAGRQLIADAAAGSFDELWVTRPDRIGRKSSDMLAFYDLMESLDIKLVGIAEPIVDQTYFGFQSVMADAGRRQFLSGSRAGMERAVREGRYCGGIVPYGFEVHGAREKARLAPSGRVAWAEVTEADIVRRIYHHLVDDGWSCARIADEFNALGIPTAYQRDGRGIRERKTQGVWRAGRIRNLVVNSIYRGEFLYGRRSKKRRRELIPAQVPRLVSDELWHAAQAALRSHRVIPEHARRVYLLRSLLFCGVCGLHYVGTAGRNSGIRYRCCGQIKGRGPLNGRCPGKSIRGDVLEAIIWRDVEMFLRNPGELLDELAAELGSGGPEAAVRAERMTLESALENLDTRRARAVDQLLRERITEAEFDGFATDIQRERRAIESRLSSLPEFKPEATDLPGELLTDLRYRLDGGLTEEQRREVLQLLLRRGTIHTDLASGEKTARVVVEDAFPVVTNDHTGTRASRNYTNARRVLVV